MTENTGGCSMFGVRKKEYIAGFTVVMITLIVYAGALGNGFVWDDTNVIANDSALRGPALSLFRTVDVTRDHEKLPYYRPLTKLSFLTEERIHGLNPLLMHLVNILLHAANAVLVFLLAKKWTDDVKAALLAGLLFAVHPVNSETVNFLSGGRNTLLACFFVLTSYFLHSSSIRRDSIPTAITAALLMLFGFLSKETALAGMVFIIALEWNNVRGKESVAGIRAGMRLLPYVAAVSCYLLMRWLTLSNLGIQSSIIPFTEVNTLEGFYRIPDVLQRLLNNIYIIPRYLLTIIWPVSLSPLYVLPTGFRPIALTLIVFWICIFALLLWLLTSGRSRATLFGFFWLLSFWLPVSGIIWFPSSLMADRFLYLPSIGLFLIMADRAMVLCERSSVVRRYGPFAAAFVLAVLAVVTGVRNLDWKNDIVLFSHIVENYPDNPYGHSGLGEAYIYKESRNDGDLMLAEQEFEKALALNPAVPGARTKLGYIRLALGDSDGAVYNYTIALGTFPLDKEALLNRGIALENIGRQKEALEDFTRFLSIPGYEFADARPYAEARVHELSRLLRMDVSQSRFLP